MEGPEMLFSAVPLPQVMREVHPCKCCYLQSWGQRELPTWPRDSASPPISLWQHFAPSTPFGNHFPNLKWWSAEKNKTQHSYFPFSRLPLILPVKKKCSMAPSSPKYCQPEYSNITLNPTRERACTRCHKQPRCGLHTLTDTAHFKCKTSRH